MKLKVGDTVQVLTGKDKGKKGKISKILPKDNAVIVDGINQFKKHRKARLQNEQSEIITITKPMNASKVGLVDPKKKKPTRIGYVIEKGEKKRVAKKGGGIIK